MIGLCLCYFTMLLLGSKIHDEHEWGRSFLKPLMATKNTFKMYEVCLNGMALSPGPPGIWILFVGNKHIFMLVLNDTKACKNFPHFS